MPTCPVCGVSNRSSARFCYQCAAPLAARAPLPDDHDWLVATLIGTPASSSTVSSTTQDSTLADARPGPTTDPPKDGGVIMEQPQQSDPAQAASLVGGRYEVVTQHEREVEVLDRQPWLRCWACGATTNEAGEYFCIECGAALAGRRYRGEIVSGDSVGLAFVPTITQTAAREVLPLIWDQVRDGDALLTLIAESGRPALVPPIEDLDALHVGRGLAHLLDGLHAEGFVLGALSPRDVELSAAGMPRLRAAPGLRRVAEDPQEAVASDVRALATLLEALTDIPRTTRRLDDDGQVESDGPVLGDVLREMRTGALPEPGVLATRLEALIAERTQPTPLWARVGASTHHGMVRELDEDSLLVLDLRAAQNGQGRSWGLYIVADGMGGHAAGEVASGLAIRGAAEVVMSAYLAPTLESDAQYDEVQFKEIVRKAIVQANEYVLREARARGNDMGTTITMALVVGDRAVIGNVGDSRTYLFRDGQLRRVSRDHSLVMRLVELGQITEDDIYTHPQRNAVLRSLGDKPEVEIDVFSERLRPGDALFLCSDGQWEMTHDPEMAQIIQKHADPLAVCQALMQAANAAGGEDNITAVLVRFEGFGA